MKKFVVLTLFGLLIMAISATVYAMDFKASGFIDAIGVYNTNVPRYNAAAGTFQVVHPDYGFPFSSSLTADANKALNKKEGFWTSRMRLQFDAVMDKNLSGTIFFEADSTRWGDITGGQGGKLRESGSFGFWSADRVALEIKNVYIDFGLPYIGIPVPMTFRVGLQPLAIRPNMFVYTDGIGIAASAKVIDMVNLQFLYFKALEGKDWSADDVTVWGGQVNAKIQAFTIGGYALHYNMNSYPFTVGAALNTTLAGVSSLFGLVTGTFQSAMTWWGVYADGKAGPVNFNFDFILDHGKAEERNNLGAAPDVKYIGWASRAKIDFPWEKFNFGVVGMYASGADAKKTSASGLPGTSTAFDSTTLSTKNKAFVVPPGSEEGPIFQEGMVVYGSIFGVSEPMGIGNNANYNALSRGAIGGTAMAKLYASVKAVPWYKITLQGLYVWDTTKNGNTFGNAVNTTGFLRNDKNVGFELDLINDINIYKNLTFSFGGGYLWAGDALDLRDRSLPAGVFGNFSPKNPWIIATKLLYTF